MAGVAPAGIVGGVGRLAGAAGDTVPRDAIDDGLPAVAPRWASTPVRTAGVGRLTGVANDRMD